MLDLRPSETHVLMTGVSVDLENISVVKVTSGVNARRTRLIKEHYMFCTKSPNKHIATVTYFRVEAAVARFYERRNAAWDTKIHIMVPAIAQRLNPLQVKQS